jgi:hypothetical protein
MKWGELGGVTDAGKIEDLGILVEVLDRSGGTSRRALIAAKSASGGNIAA